MSRRRSRPVVSRAAAAVAVLAGAIAGMVLLSGTGQPVTAQPYPPWQQVAAPPLSPRTGALGLRVGHRVLVLGGTRAGTASRDGAAYDLRTGRWRHLVLPVPLTSYDAAVAAAGVAVVRHGMPSGRAVWWAFDPTPGSWRRLAGVPRGAAAPTAFGSEVYALSGRRVVVYSVALGRWTPLPPDPIRPALTGRRVAASRSGTVVTGYAGHVLVADRWDGLRWHRTGAAVPTVPELPPRLPAAVPGTVAADVPIGGRWLVVAGGQAWIGTPFVPPVR